MTVKWATLTFNTVLTPIFARHQWYYAKKVALDRYLESRGAHFIVGTASVLGATLGLMITSFRPNPSNSTLFEGTGNLWEIMRSTNTDDFKMMPHEAYFRAQDEIYSKVLAMRDQAEVRIQREEVEALKAKLSMK